MRTPPSSPSTSAQGVTWSDGTPLNANDFVYSWKRVLDPNTRLPVHPALYPIKNAEKIVNGELTLDDLGVEAVDDYTLKVTLEGPTTYFPLLASTWTFYPVPKHVIDEKGEAVGRGREHRLQRSVHHDRVDPRPADRARTESDLLRREADPDPGGVPLFADTAAQSYVAFENNELDYARRKARISTRPRRSRAAMTNVLQFQRSNCYFVVCDTTNAPTDKAEFRQALSKSIDRETLAETVLNNQYEPAFSNPPRQHPRQQPGGGCGRECRRRRSNS